MKSFNTKREQFYELHVTPEQRQARAERLRILYVLCDPRGWDAKRHRELAARCAGVCGNCGHSQTVHFFGLGRCVLCSCSRYER